MYYDLSKLAKVKVNVEMHKESVFRIGFLL